MMHVLKQGLDSGKLHFGIKQALKKADSIEKVYISMDCRNQVKSLLEKNKLDVIQLNLSKNEISIQLAIGFKSEVFSLLK